MHHVAVKSDSNEGKKTQLGYEGSNDLPVCPKPCRLKPFVPPELLKPLQRTNTCSQTNHDGRSEILNMLITDKKTEERESLCYYSGSPPSRTGNPLIHDVHFIHQVELFSPLASLKN